jgi:phosphoribosylamine--glycine ligase
VSAKRILVVGSGAREHALAWRLARDPERPEVLVAPGNEGIGRSFPCLPCDPVDAARLGDVARERAVDLVVIGPEAPLAAGLADALAADHLLVFGPSREAARLESSKWFAKRLMIDRSVPTAPAERFENPIAAREALDRFGPPYVLKADGLAAGKGVCITAERSAAEHFIAECLEGGRLGPGGRRLVIERFLEGEEATVMAVCDGERFLLLPPARDYKRAHDGDRGPNTGGMGAVAPAGVVDARLEDEIARRIVKPVLEEMARRGTPFRGVLYCGLMIHRGLPHVVEFNVRFGDPEAEVVLPLLSGSLGRLLESSARGALEPAAVARAPRAAVAVALVDRDYPGAVSGEGEIEGLESLAARGPVEVFHAGAVRGGRGWRVTAGRAACVMAEADDVATARARAYDAIASLGGRGWRCRRDVAGAPAAAANPGASVAGNAGGRP